MSYALTFARHFARLVQMLLLEGSADFEKQLATLRSLVTVSEQGPVKLVLHDMQLLSANAEVVPARFEGVDGLVAQLIGHSILEIAFQQNALPADLMLAAKLLSVAASPGNGGEVALARVRALDAQTISLKVDMPVQPQAAAALPNSKLGNAGSGFVRNSMTMFMPTTGQFEAVQAGGAEVGGGATAMSSRPRILFASRIRTRCLRRLPRRRRQRARWCACSKISTRRRRRPRSAGIPIRS